MKEDNGRKLKEIGERIGSDFRIYGGAAVWFAAYYVTAHFLFRAICPMVILTGFPCPGCGMTRAVFCFATGQFARGWRLNPLGILWLLLILYFIVMRYGLGKRPAGILKMGGILIALMVIFYLYRMYRYFPGNPPVSYTPGSILEQRIPGYRAWIHELVRKLRT